MMRNLLAFLALTLIAFVGVGWYQGWYSVQTTPGTAGHRQVSIDVDEQKVSEDLRAGGKKVTEKIGQILDKKDPEAKEQVPQ